MVALRGEGDCEGLPAKGDPDGSRRWRGRGVDLGGRAVQCLMYADDITLVAETGADLQRMLDALHAYCRRWQMFVNVRRWSSEVVVFRNGGEITESFSYAGMAPQVVDFFQYLGVIFRRDGKVDHCQAIQTRVSAANKVFGMFVRRVTAWMFDLYMESRMVTTYVRTVLLYDSEVSPGCPMARPHGGRAEGRRATAARGPAAYAGVGCAGGTRLLPN